MRIHSCTWKTYFPVKINIIWCDDDAFCQLNKEEQREALLYCTAESQYDVHLEQCITSEERLIGSYQATPTVL